MFEKIKSILFGVAVGDALGVPVEFMGRGALEENPVIDMRAYGSHNQPKGTWSDDSSMTFCLVESLIKGYDLEDIANNFVKWCYEDYWTPHGQVFDIGIGTQKAIDRVMNKSFPVEVCGGMSEMDNGNGSLMRIAPLAIYLKGMDIQKRYELIQQVSSITHGHIRSVIGCFIYIELILELMEGKDKVVAYQSMKKTGALFLEKIDVNKSEIQQYKKILHDDIREYPQSTLKGSGYVVESLEASLWCFLTSDSYKEAVLKAVNLGQDTDTTGAITGGLAGLYFGYDTIPIDWVDVIAKKEEILNLCKRFEKSI